MGIDEEFDRFVKASFVGLCRTGYLICGDRQRADELGERRVGAGFGEIGEMRLVSDAG